LSPKEVIKALQNPTLSLLAFCERLGVGFLTNVTNITDLSQSRREALIFPPSLQEKGVRDLVIVSIFE
jgi:hypothetical protein